MLDLDDIPAGLPRDPVDGGPVRTDTGLVYDDLAAEGDRSGTGRRRSPLSTTSLRLTNGTTLDGSRDADALVDVARG